MPRTSKAKKRSPAGPDYSVESTLSGLVAGIDEAGRGPLAGPVVAAAVILNPSRIPPGIQDSKKIPAPKREELFHRIVAEAQTAIGIATVEEIDSINILQATKLAMCRAFEHLPVRPVHALIDGNQPPDLPCEIKPIIRGDSLCVSIAAASIIAKVTRDRIMRELALEYPHYGWDTNAGYSTEYHYEAIRIHGVTRHHRRSFAPVRQALEAMAGLRQVI